MCGCAAWTLFQPSIPATLDNKQLPQYLVVLTAIVKHINWTFLLERSTLQHLAVFTFKDQHHNKFNCVFVTSSYFNLTHSMECVQKTAFSHNITMSTYFESTPTTIPAFWAVWENLGSYPIVLQRVTEYPGGHTQRPQQNVGKCTLQYCTAQRAGRKDSQTGYTHTVRESCPHSKITQYWTSPSQIAIQQFRLGPEVEHG